jgi:DNA ligase-1
MTIVVSGDYKRRRDPTCRLFEPVPCDVFVSEATFGLPVFRHPPDSGEIQKLLKSLQQFPERSRKRSGFYSDYTFGVWRTQADGSRALTPVGKAYFGFTDEELTRLDKFVRDNAIERFGPVRSVRATSDFGMVLEIAFEGLQRSARHKSGVAMRFPRVNRIRWDKPAREADELSSLERLLAKEA